MLFVPEINTFIKYLEARSKFHKTVTEKLRQNIIESDKNIFLFNIDYINCLEKIIDENHPLKDECNLFIKALIDNDELGLNLNIEYKIENIEYLFEKLSLTEIEDEILIGVSESIENFESNYNILNINNISNVNKNYIYSKFLTNEVCQIRHFDLENRSEILSLLNYSFSLYNKIDEVIIIDRQTNLNHNIYNNLIDRGVKFYYYTLYADASDSISLKNKLKRYQIYSTSNEDLIHERLLVVKDMVITMDEDPFNIEHRNTWLITIQVCKSSVNKIKTEKCSLFNNTLFFKN